MTRRTDTGSEPPVMGLVTVYGVAIFLAAALLFVVQPMVGRMVLPRFGGSPEVWNTSMVFFQVALLAGYAYAHFSVRWLGLRRQIVVHGLILLLPFLTLPVSLPGWSARPGSWQSPWILLLLTVAVGAPFFVLSTASPLLQRWFASTGLEGAEDPYFLYAASNAGSFVGLLSYPFLVEPYLPLGAQSRLWALGYALFVGLVVLCAVPVLRGRRSGAASSPAPTEAWGTGPGEERRAEQGGGRGGESDLVVEGVEMPDLPPDTAGRSEGALADVGQGKGGAGVAGDGGVVGDRGITGDPDTLSTRDRLFWILCAFVPSSLLLAVTHYLTTEVAAIPLLWVLPLAVYLLTYVAAFSRRLHVGASPASRLMAVATVGLVLTFLAGVREPVWAMLLLHLGGLTAAGLLCHGRLAESRPSATHLTEFYLLVALGGVLGGAFNALAAPVLFDDVLEYPIVLVVACLLMVPGGRRAESGVGGSDPGSNRASDRGSRAVEDAAGPGAGSRRIMDFLWPLLLAAFLLGVRAGLDRISGLGDGAMALLAAAVPALALYLFSNRRLRFGLGVAVALFFAYAMPIQRGDLVMAERTFFGVSRIVHDPEGEFLILFHGTTVHGVQSTDPARAGEPLGYYHPERPGGRVVRTLVQQPGGRDLAFVGLGTGALSVLAGPDDDLTFYEIDPAVVRIAENPEYFTYLDRTPADYEVVLGDGRIELERSNRRFDVIVLDAFSSASVPVHLLTREAVQVYLDHLAPGGVLLFHVSSQHLELAPVLGAVAGDLGLAAAEAPPYEGPDDLERGILPSQWVLMGRETEDILPYVSGRWRPLPADPGTRVWTDDFADVLSVYRWN